MPKDDQFSFEQKDVSKTRFRRKSASFWDKISRKYSGLPIKVIEALRPKK